MFIGVSSIVPCSGSSTNACRAQIVQQRLAGENCENWRQLTPNLRGAPGSRSHRLPVQRPRRSRTIARLWEKAEATANDAAALLAAGCWQDEAALREALAGLSGKLAVLGLRICMRKAGLRVARLKVA